jgi:hypothetical protein
MPVEERWARIATAMVVVASIFVLGKCASETSAAS